MRATMENNVTFVDNLKQTREALAVVIYSFVKQFDANVEQQRIAERLEGTFWFDCKQNTESGRLECGFNVEIKPQFPYVKDADGNLWSEYEVVSQVNWPAWGSTEPNLAGARIELMSKVCLFAKDIKETSRKKFGLL